MRWIIVLLLFPAILSAQDCRVSGRVVDTHTNEPLIGANVMITYAHPDTMSRLVGAAATNAHGEFTVILKGVSCPKDMTLQVSYIGYKRIEFQLLRENQSSHIELADIALSADKMDYDWVRKPMIDRGQTNFRTVIYQEDIEHLPIR